ncbi:hypothetical protein MQE36_06745 [Zhouia spongiae]|uniref:Uncharacterized protein n=1 Tax=Zhouia spongiae TaxID=2202721 RepID=A0ABY3YQK6_9FLAO|nr:hypothetical protein [Zhouia spongiae]UNZ00040.1 hypothetical protein MQE36_06745 [Zhouia spongiae]
MNIGHLKNKIAFAFLALFLTMRLGGLHAYAHTDDHDHGGDCIICDFAVTHGHTPAIPIDDFDFNIEYIQEVIDREIIKHYNFLAVNSIESNQLFSRPPPAIR